MSEKNWIFIETWVDAGGSIPVVLLLICKNDTLYEIITPYQNNKVIFSVDNYQEATYWLAEDEFVKTGRLLYEEFF